MESGAVQSQGGGRRRDIKTLLTGVAVLPPTVSDEDLATCAT